MKQISLYDSLGFGLIIELPTGVMVSNQTGGNACLQPAIEGIYIPVANDIFTDSNALNSPETDLTQHFLSSYSGSGATDGIDLKDVEAIESILEKYCLNDFITIDTSKLYESHEAWIWVKINVGSENNRVLKNFGQSVFKGVITWTNSD